jgi:molybdopterin synthase sulfur carrier subunit
VRKDWDYGLITVELPKALCSYADDNSSLVLEESCDTVGEALAALGRKSRGALDRIMDERGNLRPHVNLFVNGENIRFLDGLKTPAGDGATILVLAAVSGG